MQFPFPQLQIASQVQEQVGGQPSANLVNGGLDEVFTRTEAAGDSTPLLDAMGSTVALLDSNGVIQTEYTYSPLAKQQQAVHKVGTRHNTQVGKMTPPVCTSTELGTTRRCYIASSARIPLDLAEDPMCMPTRAIAQPILRILSVSRSTLKNRSVRS